jgi:hypothetical protein
VIDDSHDAAGQEVLMLDHPKKTRELISILEAAVARVSEPSSEAEEARSDIARLSWCKGKARSAGILSNAAASVLPWSGFVQDEVSSVPGQASRAGS